MEIRDGRETNKNERERELDGDQSDEAIKGK